MSLTIQTKTIKGLEMYLVVLGETVLASSWSEQGARTQAAQLLNKVKGV